MSEILGITISVLHFLDNAPALYQITRDENTVEFCLKKDRKYVVPMYQREIRWDEKQLLRLMFDINNGKSFLGNIILDQRKRDFEIVDGQQRITILYLLIHCIRRKLEGEDVEFEPCLLQLDSFSRFTDAMCCGFQLDRLSGQLQRDVEESDLFYQNERYRKLWEVMQVSDYLCTPSACKRFLEKLKQCKLNVSKANPDSIDHGIEYFLDVNLKGVGLDAEDTFKAQLFSLGSGDEIRKLWISFKQTAFRLNRGGARQNCYPLMLLLEHWLYCNLYREERYQNVRFNSQFRITKEVELDKGDRRYPGEHIITLINQQMYMKKCLCEVIEVLEVLLELAENPSYPGSFGARFSPDPETGKRISVQSVTIIFNLLKKILLDSERIPKILVFKYIQEVLLHPGSQRKQDYEKIYAVYTLDVFFSVFAKKKSSDKIYSIMRDEHWYEHITEQVKGYFSTDGISKRRLEASYYAAENDRGDGTSSHSDLYRSKSLATIYNFLSLQGENLLYKKHGQLYSYLEEENQFSTEHFILNEGGWCMVSYTGGSCKYLYPHSAKKYINSLFNFIFIPKALNESLENKPLPEKIALLRGQSLACEYSSMILTVVSDCFHLPDCSQLTSNKDVKAVLDDYYIHRFENEYVSFAQKVVGAFFQKKFTG